MVYQFNTPIMPVLLKGTTRHRVERGMSNPHTEEATMTRHINVVEVGAPDPELRNSPVFDDTAQDSSTYEFDVESSLCYFNDLGYRIGDYICSGAELLHCEERGIWVRKGSCYGK